MHETNETLPTLQWRHTWCFDYSYALAMLNKLHAHNVMGENIKVLPKHEGYDVFYLSENKY